MDIVVCYESDCGGETIATQAILRALDKYPHISVASQKFPPLIYTDSLRFFGWVFYSIYRWFVFLWEHRFIDWVYITTFPAGVAAGIIKPFGRFKILWHYHGTRIPPLPPGLRGKVFITQWIKRWMVYTLHCYFIPRTSAIITPSIQGENELTQTFKGVSLPPVYVIPNGVDFDRFAPISKTKRVILRQKHGINKDARVLLSVGRLERQKGIETLFSVCSRLIASEPNTAFLLAYPKIINPTELAYKKELGETAAVLGIEKHILWKEDVKKIEEMYQMSDLTISLSQQETYGLTVLESFACGVLFMGTPVGAASPILLKIDKRLCVPRTMKFVEIARRIEIILLLSPVELETMRRMGKKIARQYTWDRTVRGIEKALRGYQG